VGLTRDRWLIPGALGFLALAVLSAVVMLAYPFGGRPVAAPLSPSPSLDAPVSPSPAPSPSRPPSPSPSAPASRPPSPSPAAVGTLVRGAATGLCLGVAAGEPEGAAAEEDPCGDSPAQRWRSVPVAGAVALVNVASGKCLDVANGSTDDAAKVQQWTCHGGPNQQWRVQPAGPPGAVFLVSVNSGKCLDVPAGQNGPGVALDQLTCQGGGNQQWVVGG
jgi:hypothetical protein